jgi:hypothetical protein
MENKFNNPMKKTSSYNDRHNNQHNGSNSPPARSFFVRKNDQSSQSSHETNGPAANGKIYNKLSMMSLNDLKSERFSTQNSIIKERFFHGKPDSNANKHQEPIRGHGFHHPHHHQNFHAQQAATATTASTPSLAASAQAMQTLQQIQEAKPGNKRAILVDLPEYLYSIPALASFFEPYGEVAMLQILPRQKMWDGDLIDLLGASMCNRLSQNTYCAIVEFYSARMAKFIIGILRKRLPILKFRCALLKPSAAIELTNQADNLGLENAVRLRHISKKQQQSSTSESLDSSSTTSSDGAHKVPTGLLPPPVVAEAPTSSEESGLEEMGSSSRTQTSSSSCHDSSEEERFTTNNQRTTSQTSDDKQRFVTSFQIQLNR